MYSLVIYSFRKWICIFSKLRITGLRYDVFEQKLRIYTLIYNLWLVEQVSHFV